MYLMLLLLEEKNMLNALLCEEKNFIKIVTSHYGVIKLRQCEWFSFTRIFVEQLFGKKKSREGNIRVEQSIKRRTWLIVSHTCYCARASTNLIDDLYTVLPFAVTLIIID